MARTKKVAPENGDKRSVSTDALETLGTAPLGENEARDAIHLAVEPVIAGERLFAGQHVGFDDNGNASQSAKKMLGIVDPFLKEPVYPGDRFWLVVYPRQIKSLRHVWEHPDFVNVTGEAPVLHAAAKTAVVIATTERDTAEEYLNGFANSLGVLLEELIEHAEGYVKYGRYWTGGSEFEGESVPDEFWDHYEEYTGKTVHHNDRGSFLSCSC